jgi:hypothetical protein
MKALAGPPRDKFNKDRSLAAYHWLIRPWPAMRWLMGMTSVPATAVPASPAPAEQA